MLSGGERKRERGQIGYKLIVGLTREPRNSVGETNGPHIDREDVTTVWVG